jgi:hypothetical protein
MAHFLILTHDFKRTVLGGKLILLQNLLDKTDGCLFQKLF